MATSELIIENEDFICDTCRKIDFHNLIRNARQTSIVRDKTDGPMYSIRYTKDCMVCDLLFGDVNLIDIDKTYDLRSYSFLSNTRWANHKAHGARDSVLLVRNMGTFRNIGHLEWIFCMFADDQVKGLFQAQPIDKTWNPRRTRSWLDTCIQCHESVCSRGSSIVTGMNLIDCYDMTIIAATESSRWLALSYVWGSGHQGPLSMGTIGFRHGSRLPLELPRTVQDAINVTKQLGYRYLWVDEYCIDQRNEKQRNEQIKKMDQIYRGADVTIVAAAGEDKAYGLPGVSDTRRKKKKDICLNGVVVFSNGNPPDHDALMSKWSTRAWTFQEGLLSRRLLVFTDYQMSFYCLASSCTEGLSDTGRLAATQLDWTVMPALDLFDPFKHEPLRASPLQDWPHFTNMVKQYSSRELTNDADALEAFLGVLNNLRQLRPSAYALCGLPLFEPSTDTSGKSFENSVSAALSWYPYTYGKPERRHMFPSWTWVGWRGWIHFFHLGLRADRSSSYIRHVHLESSLGHILNLATLWESGSSTIIQHTLDTVTTIYFEAPTILAQYIVSVENDESTTAPGDHQPSTIVGHPFGYAIPQHPGLLANLVENVRNGWWSCFLLSKKEDILAQDLFVLVVQWKEDQLTAERISAFDIHLSSAGNNDLELIESSTEWRCVTLI